MILLPQEVNVRVLGTLVRFGFFGGNVLFLYFWSIG